MMVMICGALAFGFGFAAAVVTRLRVALVCLWGASLCVSGLFLGMGAEFLALALALLSTLVATVLVFHTELFGRRERVPNWLVALVAFLLGDVFVVIVWASVQDVAGGWTIEDGPRATLSDIGLSIVNEQFLSAQLMAIILLTVIVGLGVISRPEVKKE